MSFHTEGATHHLLHGCWRDVSPGPTLQRRKEKHVLKKKHAWESFKGVHTYQFLQCSWLQSIGPCQDLCLSPLETFLQQVVAFLLQSHSWIWYLFVNGHSGIKLCPGSNSFSKNLVDPNISHDSTTLMISFKDHTFTGTNKSDKSAIPTKNKRNSTKDTK